MDKYASILSVLALFSLIATAANGGFIGNATIKAPAVLLYNNSGDITSISLNVTTGNGTVSFAGPEAVANSTYLSAYTAVQYASHHLGINSSKYDFMYSIKDQDANISGPSAGAAMALLAISALDHLPLNSSITITGTVSDNGSIGEVGGTINKIGAAAQSGLRLALVPAVLQGSLEESLYFIAQSEYGIPVVEVSNVPQALLYFTSPQPAKLASANKTTVNFTMPYNTAGLPGAQLACSNGCNTSPFSALVNFTILRTDQQIANLSSDGTFSGLAAQLSEVANESSAVSSKGYLYTAANLAFLDYINAYYLSGYRLQRTDALYSMQNTQNFCNGITPPQLSTANFEYVLSAEMRQGWGNITINDTISSYNVSGSTTDDILSSMYSAGQAKAWCTAAAFLYSYNYSGSEASYVSISPSLRNAALSRLDNASAYPGIYLAAAKQEYEEGNYAVSMYDSDYAYALSAASSKFSEPTSKLDGMATALAQNSTYGAWAAEFAKEADFYAYESNSTSNSLEAQADAQKAYASAALASAISADTALIGRNLVPAQPSSSTATGSRGSGTAYNNGMSSPARYATEQSLTMITWLLCIVIVLLIINLAFMFRVLGRLPKKRARRRA
jgi:predicted S18 family serine protease